MLDRLRTKLTGVPSLRQLIEEVPAHFEQHVGPIKSVFHEIVSDELHIDVHLIEASDERPYQVIFTTGVSMKALKTCHGGPPLAEMLMLLPPDWDLSDENYMYEQHFWPIRILKWMARLAHDMDHGVREFLSTQFGDPAEPAAGTDFYGVMYVHPHFWPPEARRVKLAAGPEIQLYALMPLTRREMQFKISLVEGIAYWNFLRETGQDLLQLAIADPERPSVIP